MLELVPSVRRASGPIEAAQWFVRHGGIAGFGTPASVWQVADPEQVRHGEATLVDGTASLHAVRLPNGSWAVDEGRRCS